MEPDKNTLSPTVVRRLSAFAVFVVAGFVVFDWFREPGASDQTIDAGTWLGGFLGGFFYVVLALVFVLFLLGVVLKVLDRMR